MLIKAFPATPYCPLDWPASLYLKCTPLSSPLTKGGLRGVVMCIIIKYCCFEKVFQHICPSFYATFKFTYSHYSQSIFIYRRNMRKHPGFLQKFSVCRNQRATEIFCKTYISRIINGDIIFTSYSDSFFHNMLIHRS